jgi:hypothetical protein
MTTSFRAASTATALKTPYASWIVRSGFLAGISRLAPVRAGAPCCCKAAVKGRPALAGIHSHMAPSTVGSGSTEISRDRPSMRDAECSVP